MYRIGCERYMSQSSSVSCFVQFHWCVFILFILSLVSTCWIYLFTCTLLNDKKKTKKTKTKKQNKTNIRKNCHSKKVRYYYILDIVLLAIILLLIIIIICYHYQNIGQNKSHWFTNNIKWKTMNLKKFVSKIAGVIISMA